MVMATKCSKVYETEAFTHLTRGARLFRCSGGLDNAGLSPGKLPRNETNAKPWDGTSTTISEPMEPRVGELTASTSTTSLQETPVEQNIPSNFIDRRVGTTEANGELPFNAERSCRQSKHRNTTLDVSLDALSVAGQENNSTLQPHVAETSRGDDGKGRRAESSARSCLTCSEEFEDAAAQRRHYQLDWHRCNLHRALRGRLPVTEEQFAELVDADDVSSISGSESESESSSNDSETEAGQADPSTNECEAGVGPESQRRARVFFESADQRVFSMHRCLLHSKKDAMSEDQLLAACQALAGRTKWAVILAGGGHFAAAIFHGGEIALRKTFHTYTVRRGQGTAQGVRDSRGNAPKSAGAALRRRNELTLQQDVQALLESWRDALTDVSLVFVRASPALKSSLFGGRRPPIGPRDPRLRPLPFPTRRATLAECRRAHDLLATVTRHGSAQAYRLSLRAEVVVPVSKPVTPRESQRDASREPRSRPQPQSASPSSSSDAGTGDDAGPEFQTELMDINLGDLREYQNTSKRRRKPRRGRRKAGSTEPAQGDKPGSLDPAKQDKAESMDSAKQDKAESIESTQLGQEHAAQGTNADLKGEPVNAAGEEAARTERRAALRRQRRERLRERRDEEDRQRKEEDERQRFMQLSDREKRALAAERRMASAGTPAALSRCHQCARDMTGQVPFSYLDLRFCSVACLQSHRRANI